MTIYRDRMPAKVAAGTEVQLGLPDGSMLHVDAQGNFRIDDADAQVIYQANRIREFNRFVNASDILEEFMTFASRAGVRRSEVLQLPLELFIRFLIVRAAETDGDTLPEQEPLERQLQKAISPPVPRCLGCGRFLRRVLHARGIGFCSGTHLERYRARVTG